jgi:hypothetical protein
MRYLLGALRDQLPFSEIPIKIYLRQRESATLEERVARQEEAQEIFDWRFWTADWRGRQVHPVQC